MFSIYNKKKLSHKRNILKVRSYITLKTSIAALLIWTTTKRCLFRDLFRVLWHKNHWFYVSISVPFFAVVILSTFFLNPSVNTANVCWCQLFTAFASYFTLSFNYLRKKLSYCCNVDLN